MKTTISITLDANLVTEARIKKIKFSEFFNNALKTYLEVEDDAPEDLPLEDKIINVKARLLSLEDEKKKAQEKAEAKRIEEEGVPFKIGNLY